MCRTKALAITRFVWLQHRCNLTQHNTFSMKVKIERIWKLEYLLRGVEPRSKQKPMWLLHDYPGLIIAREETISALTV